MKKTMMLAVAALFSICNIFAQPAHKRLVEVYECEDVKLHAYASFPEMEDVSFIVEGKRGLVLLEPQAYTHCKDDYESYVRGLGKPVVKVIADFHTYGLADWDPKMVVMVESMAEHEHTQAYENRMQRFAGVFKGTLDTRPHDKVSTIAANSNQTFAGISFKFSPAVLSDLPASTINIDGKFYYMHYAPEFAHLPAILLTGAKAIAPLLAELQEAKDSGCRIFFGSHGRVSYINAVEFQMRYLEKLSSTHKTAKSKAEFLRVMKSTFYALPGEDDLEEVANILYNR